MRQVFLAFLLVLCFLVPAWAACGDGSSTCYVDTTISTGDNDGTTWPNAFRDTDGTALNDAYTAAAEGDVIELHGAPGSSTTYAELGSNWSKDHLKLLGSRVTDHDGEVIVDDADGSTTTTFTFDGMDQGLENITVKRTGGSAGEFAIYVADNVLDFYIKDVDLKNYTGYGFRLYESADLIHHVYIDNMRVYASSSTAYPVWISGPVTFLGGYIEGFGFTGTGPAVEASSWFTSADFDFYNYGIYNLEATGIALSQSDTVNIYNSTVGPVGLYGSEIPVTVASGSTFNAQNFLRLASPLTPALYNTGTVTEIEPNWENVVPGWRSVRGGMFTVMADDLWSIGASPMAGPEYYEQLQSKMDEYGVYGTIFIGDTYTLTSAEVTKLRGIIDAGHEVGFHTATHSEMDQANGMTFTHSGGTAADSVTVATGGTSLTLTDDVGSDDCGPYDLTSTAYDTFEEVEIEIDANCTNWTSDVYPTSGTKNNDAFSISFDAGTVTGCNSGCAVPLDITGADARFYVTELTNAITDLENCIKNGASTSAQTSIGTICSGASPATAGTLSASFQAKTMAWPYNTTNATVIAWVKANIPQIQAARSSSYIVDAEASANLEDINIFDLSLAVQDWVAWGTGTQAQAEEAGRAIANGINSGMFYYIMAHDADEISVAQFGFFFDALMASKKGSTLIGSFENNSTYLINNWTDDGDDTYSKTYSDRSYLLGNISPLIGKGLTTTLDGVYGTLPECTADASTTPPLETFTYRILANDYTKAASTISFPAPKTAIASGSWSVWAVDVDKDGTLTITETSSPDDTIANAYDGATGVSVASGDARVGYLGIKAGASGFTPDTHNTNAAANVSEFVWMNKYIYTGDDPDGVVVNTDPTAANYTGVTTSVGPYTPSLHKAGDKVSVSDNPEVRNPKRYWLFKQTIQ